MNYLWSIITANDGSESLALLALAAAKSTLLLAFVALLCLSFRRFSAATRHLLWVSVICVSLLLPCLSFLMIWEVPVLPAPESVLSEFGTNESTGNDLFLETREVLLDKGDSVQENFESRTNVESLEETSFISNLSSLPAAQNETYLSPKTVNGILAVWLAGTLLLLFRLFVGFSAASLLARRAVEFKSAAYGELFSSLLNELDLKGKIRLLRSERTLMPVVCGVLRPTVLLPASVDEWSGERLRMVLLHELTHVARRDCLTQLLGQTACAFYWFNPLVWYAARRLRVEREQACDDRVLNIGTKPSDYAHHLLEIARSMQNRSVFDWSKPTTVAMARRSQFERRLLAILSVKSGRCRMSRLMTASVVALICVLSLSVAVIRPTIINAQKSQSSKTDFNDENEKAEMSLSNSFSTIERDSQTIQDSETDEPIKKQENADAQIDNQREERVLTDEQIYENVEQNIKLDVKDDAKQNISENVEERIALSVKSPEINSPPAPEINTFINAEYQRESKPQTQNKSGDFIDEMASVGFTNLSVDELIMLKTHRVTADFVRGLRAAGFNNLTPKVVTNLRIYNITPAYIEAMAAAGYKGLPLKDLTNARIHRVTPEFVKAIQNAGYPSLSIGQMIEFRIHNITPELIRSARSRLGDLTPKQIVSLKISGVLNKVEDKKENKD